MVYLMLQLIYVFLITNNKNDQNLNTSTHRPRTDEIKYYNKCVNLINHHKNY